MARVRQNLRELRGEGRSSQYLIGAGTACRLHEIGVDVRHEPEGGHARDRGILAAWFLFCEGTIGEGEMLA